MNYAAKVSKRKAHSLRIKTFNEFLISLGHDVEFSDYKEKRVCPHCQLIFRLHKTANYQGSPGYTLTIRNGGEDSSFYEGIRMAHYSLEILQRSKYPITEEFKIRIACDASPLAKLRSFL